MNQFISYFGTDLPDLNTRVFELQNQKAGVAAVEQAETVAARFNFQVGPGKAVDHLLIAEELRIPDGRALIHFRRIPDAAYGTPISISGLR
jgi:hypothetical protein